VMPQAVAPSRVAAPEPVPAPAEDIFGAFKSLTSTARGPASGKTGKELADEIERARQRMLASRQAEESAKEFLLAGQTKVNAAIPLHAPVALAERPVAPVRPRRTAAERYALVDDEPVPVSAPRQAPARELPLRESLVQPEPVVQQEQIQLSELQAELAD